MAIKPLTPNPVEVNAEAFLRMVQTMPWNGVPPIDADRPFHVLAPHKGGAREVARYWSTTELWELLSGDEHFTPASVAAMFDYVGPSGTPEECALARAFLAFSDTMAKAGLLSVEESGLHEARERLTQAELAYRRTLRG